MEKMAWRWVVPLGTVTGLVLSVIVIEVVNIQVGIVAGCSGPGEGGMEP